MGTGTVRRAKTGQDLFGERGAVARVHRRGDDPGDNLVAVELLDRDVRRVAERHGDRVLDHLLDLAGAGVRAEAGPELDSLGLSERGDRALEQDAVGHHDPVGAADERRVEETLLPDHALRLPGEDASL